VFLAPNGSNRLSFDGAPLIALVNNMPDAALHSTERQFRELLASATEDYPIEVRVFSLPGIPRSEIGRRYVDEYHESIDLLWDLRVDGLIVTGTEPRAPILTDEPYWSALENLVDWADRNTSAAIWSCLAAHGAVQHLDGIGRHALSTKRTGVFVTVKVGEHPLLAGGPANWQTPHSRQNDISKTDLISSGYQILSLCPDAGIDMFSKRRRSLFLFMQGHPEYDPPTLFREYRRDVRRFLTGERGDYPEMPFGYFASRAVEELLAFRERGLHERDPALLALFPSQVAQAGLRHPWRSAAMRVYTNWLLYLRQQRASRAGLARTGRAIRADLENCHRSMTGRARPDLETRSHADRSADV
jgi:homoserine O-succinyltransferase/O-acetyltransferase